jgi:hypothetical protein
LARLVVAFRTALVRVTAHVSPVDGETELTRVTVPVKPWRPVSVTVDVPVEPARTVTTLVDVMIVKSCTVRATTFQ